MDRIEFVKTLEMLLPNQGIESFLTDGDLSKQKFDAVKERFSLGFQLTMVKRDGSYRGYKLRELLVLAFYFDDLTKYPGADTLLVSQNNVPACAALEALKAVVVDDVRPRDVLLGSFNELGISLNIALLANSMLSAGRRNPVKASVGATGAAVVASAPWSAPAVSAAVGGSTGVVLKALAAALTVTLAVKAVLVTFGGILVFPFLFAIGGAVYNSQQRRSALAVQGAGSSAVAPALALAPA